MRHYFSTSIMEIGTMGVGMYLYFWIVRIVSIVFLCCTLFSIPAMILNHQVCTVCEAPILVCILSTQGKMIHETSVRNGGRACGG